MWRRRTRLGMLATSLALLASVSGCGLLGGSDGSDDAAANGGPLEKSKIKLSIMPTIDLAPFHLATKKNYFAEEGLEVETVTAPSGQASLTKLISGEVDIAYGSYAPFFVAQAQGAADIKFVADASSAAPNSTVIVALPDSSVKTVDHLAGKKIGITARNTIIEVLVKSTMRTHGVSYDDVQWVEIPFPDTAAALQRGDVDAAFLTEPFITQAAKSIGAVTVVDTATGPTKDLPTAGFGSTAEFTNENPKTVAAFQRVMQRATNEALADRSKIEPLLVEFAKVDADTAALTTLLKFESKLDPTRLQRVPDLMHEFNLIPNKIDASTMIAQPSSS
ncbi:ABC transporter substrate-binding protein [Amycolatopsis arida]